MRNKYIYGIIILIVPVFTYAENKNDYYITVGPSFTNYRSFEPEGNTKRESVNIPLVIKSELHMNRIDRFSVAFKQLNFNIAAGNNGLGISVDGYQISTSWERKVRLSRNIKPWFGVGVITNTLKFTDRHTTDDGGFLIDRLNSRRDTSFSLLLSATIEWELTREFFIEANTAYERPFSDGLEGYGFGVGIKYLF